MNVAHEPEASTIRWRAVIVAVFLVVPNAYFVIGAEVLSNQGFPTRVALFYTVVFIVFVVTLLNTILENSLPGTALTRPELGFLYVLLSLGASLAGTDMLQGLMIMIGHPFWFATPENDWKNLYWQYIPHWLTVQDLSVLNGFYKGEGTIYTQAYLKVWIGRVLIWGGFASVLVLTLLCINVILRKQWIEREKLTYPIIQLPLEITRGRHFFSQKLLWYGFGLAGGIGVLNGLSYLIPSIPYIPIKAQNVSMYFTEKPWSAIGGMLIGFYPFLIGISYLVPLDLCFSVWFFYLFFKAERIIGSVLGLEQLPRFPFITEQSFGAYIGLCTFAIWSGRKFFREVLRKAIGMSSALDDRREPMPYRWAVMGAVCGMALLVLFSCSAGMSPWVAITFFAIYFVVSTTIARMRAELGAPEHSFARTAPGIAMISMFGTRRLAKKNLLMFAYYFWFTRTYRGHPGPHQLEGFKIADTTGLNVRQLAVFMALYVVIAAYTAMWILLHCSYDLGATTKIQGWYTNFGEFTFGMLDGWVKTPTTTNVIAVVSMGVGLLFTFFLQAMRMRFFWWPFHGVGYALSGSLYMDWVWLPFFVGWVAKALILRFRGISGYRQLRPFFLGLILGEFTVGSIWNLIGFALDYPMYKFWR